jgi:hypothetical protein
VGFVCFWRSANDHVHLSHRLHLHIRRALEINPPK